MSLVKEHKVEKYSVCFEVCGQTLATEGVIRLHAHVMLQASPEIGIVLSQKRLTFYGVRPPA